MDDNRRIRVFVSSTFRDMKEERDELMTQTWPELRRFCHERQVELVEVDLRWGIAEEQSTRKETLKLCLDEIRLSRPFFIGLLGERYGWTPGTDAFTADLKEEQPWLKDLSGKSVTELEILHGVLNNPDMAGRSFFYFRDPAYAKSRGADFLSENAEAADKQTALKTLIRKTCAREHLPLRENYPNPRTLATFVHDDLKTAIEAQFPIVDIPDPLTREARDHEAFAETRCRTYIDRPDYYKKLDTHASRAGAPLVLLGDSGCGKSALLANWLNHWRKAHPGDLIFQHYIGGTRDSAEHWRLMTRLMAEIKRWSGGPEELPRSHDDLLRDFPIWLAKARLTAERDGVRFILVLDALNQLEDRDHARLLGWLPSHSFIGPLRLIVSTLPVKPPTDDPRKAVDDPLKVLTDRGWESLRVEPLTLDERRRMIADYLKRFGKTLDGARIDRLSAAAAAAKPLYLKILLDELRVNGTHELLDQHLTDYLKAPDIPALLKKVLVRYQRDYERDRPRLVSEALGLIWAARRGLTEVEILRLLKPMNLAQLPIATWSPLRAALEEGLVDRGGVLNFAHDSLRAAVEAAFVPAPSKRNELRLRLADDFDLQPVSPRSSDELAWLLQRLGARDRLRRCLLNVKRCLFILDRSQDELMDYWCWLGEERTMGGSYCEAFLAWAKTPDNQGSNPESDPRDALRLYDMSTAANRLARFLNYASLYKDAELLSSLATTIDNNNPIFVSPVLKARNLNESARSLFAQGRLREAEALWREALEIAETNFGPDDRWVGTALNNIATVLTATNRAGQAEPLLRRALAIYENSYGPGAPEVAIVLNSLVAVVQTFGKMSEAESLARRALAIDERYFGPDHATVSTRLSSLAGVLRNNKTYNEAERLYRRALAIDENRFGPDNPEVGTSLDNLASVLHEVRRFSEAEPLMRRALAIREKEKGTDHPAVATSLNNLAELLRATNRFAEAKPLFHRAACILLNCARLNGYVPPELKFAMNNYILFLMQTGLAQQEAVAAVTALAREYGILPRSG